MIALVFTIGALNILLGFGLAVAWERAPRVRDVLPQIKTALRRLRKAKQIKDAHKPDDISAELPPSWVEKLAAEAIVASSFVEASMQVLRLDVATYREQLLELDSELRQMGAAPPAAKLAALPERAGVVNRDWLAQETGAVAQLSGRRGKLGNFENAGQSLETVLLEQASQIEITLTALGELKAADPAAGAARFATELVKLLDLAHVLRDRLYDSLAAILWAEDKVGTLEKPLQFDAKRGMRNRFGLEMLLYEMWRDDAARERPAVCLMFDVDGIGKLNTRWGPRRADELLTAVGKWLSAKARAQQIERIASTGGGTFCLLLPDADAAKGALAMDGLRQALAAVTFQHADEKLTLAASCCAVTVAAEDTSAALLTRARGALDHARQAGGARTSLDNGAGPEPFTSAPQEYSRETVSW